MTRILVASPIRQAPDKLRACLTSLTELETDGFDLDFAFIDDTTDPLARQVLRDYAGRLGAMVQEAGDEQPVYVTDATTHHWRPVLFRRVAAFKDELIQLALDGGYDGIFFLDSDLVLHPRTVAQLVATGLPICSEIFWTRWTPDGPEHPQVWARDQYTLFPHERHEEIEPGEAARRTEAFLAQLRTPGVYEVGGLGACTLIRREALERGARFREITNLSVTGEDRDFCVRANALGISLHVDTHYPALHLYRPSDLERIAGFKAAFVSHPSPPPAARESVVTPSPSPAFSRAKPIRRKASGNRVTLSMLVHNEADRYLRQVLTHAASYVDDAVIIDDGSTDDSVAICRDALCDLPHVIISSNRSLFQEESALRQRQWEMTMATNPDWVLVLDADEQFDDSIRAVLPRLINQTDCDVLSFRLYDMWSETEYRDDGWWQAHSIHRPFLVRGDALRNTSWSNAPVHAGRFSPAINELVWWMSPVRIKHFGWARAEDRAKKFERYRASDPDGRHGSRAQYESILDPNPTLRAWGS